MVEVDIRWRPSGGRGEYEHVPSDVLLDRRVSLAIPGYGVTIETDVSCVIRDGKPRLRRTEPNNRSRLNIPPLVAALALLPEPRRDKNTPVSSALEDGYIAEQIRFGVLEKTAETVTIEPLSLKVRGLSRPINLRARYYAIAAAASLIEDSALKDSFAQLVGLSGWTGLDAAKNVAKSLRAELERHPTVLHSINAPATELEDTPKETETAPTQHVPPPPKALSAEEAKERYRTHRVLERSRKLRDAKIKHHLSCEASLACEACGFDFGEFYGDIGDGYIEVHHKVPLAELPPNVVTTVDDLALLCANCHRIAHRKRKTLSVLAIREAVELRRKHTD